MLGLREYISDKRPQTQTTVIKHRDIEVWARIHPDLEPLLWKDGPVRIDYGFEISEISREDSEIPIRDVILPEDRYTKINGVRVLPETIRIIEKLPPPPRPLSVWRRLLRWIGTVRKIDQ